jgi:hypothetical protein
MHFVACICALFWYKLCVFYAVYVYILCRIHVMFMHFILVFWKTVTTVNSDSTPMRIRHWIHVCNFHWNVNTVFILCCCSNIDCFIQHNLYAEVRRECWRRIDDVRRQVSTQYAIRRTTYDVHASGALTALSDIVKCRTFCILCCDFSFVLIDTRMITGSRPLAACRPAMMPSQEFGKTIMPSHDVSQHGEQCTPLL